MIKYKIVIFALLFIINTSLFCCNQDSVKVKNKCIYGNNENNQSYLDKNEFESIIDKYNEEIKILKINEKYFNSILTTYTAIVSLIVLLGIAIGGYFIPRKQRQLYKKELKDLRASVKAIKLSIWSERRFSRSLTMIVAFESTMYIPLLWTLFQYLRGYYDETIEGIYSIAEVEKLFADDMISRLELNKKLINKITKKMLQDSEDSYRDIITDASYVIKKSNIEEVKSKSQEYIDLLSKIFYET